MQSTISEYGSPYLAICHVTFTFIQNLYFILKSHMCLFGTNVLFNFVYKYMGTSADNMNKTLHYAFNRNNNEI